MCKKTDWKNIIPEGIVPELNPPTSASNMIASILSKKWWQLSFTTTSRQQRPWTVNGTSSHPQQKLQNSNDHEHSDDGSCHELEEESNNEQNYNEEMSANFMGKGAPTWQTKGKGKQKGQSEGVCWNCRKTRHTSRECDAAKRKGKSNGYDSKCFKGGFKGDVVKSKGRGINAF